jgi:hypothetical protein
MAERALYAAIDLHSAPVEGTRRGLLPRAAAVCVIVLALSSLGACAPGGRDGIAVAHRHGAGYSFGHWMGLLGVAHFLSLVRFNDSTTAQRALIATPNGAAVVLSSLINAPTGERRFRIAADFGGWWLEVKETVDLKMERFDEFSYEMWRIKRQRYSLECSDGARVGSDSMEGLIEGLRSGRRLDTVGASDSGIQGISPRTSAPQIANRRSLVCAVRS